jgi:hypothetical protein
MERWRWRDREMGREEKGEGWRHGNGDMGKEETGMRRGGAGWE